MSSTGYFSEDPPPTPSPPRAPGFTQDGLKTNGISPCPSLPESAASEEIVLRRVTPAESHDVPLVDGSAGCESGDPPDVLGRRRFDSDFAQLNQNVLDHRLSRATAHEAQVEHLHP